MKHYDVYGMGNALLDLEFDVSPAFLHQHQIEKGLSTLVDKTTQEALIADLGADRVRKVASGGSAANTMITLQHFGGKGFYSCKIANDTYGDQYHHDMAAAGLASNITADNREPGTTGTCLVLVTADSDRTMKSHLGISETFSVAQLDQVALSGAQYLYIEGYLVTSSTAMEAVLEAKAWAKQQGVKVALTLSDPGVVKHFKPQFQQILSLGVDLLFCNEEEAFEYTNTHLLDAAQTALKGVAQQFVITRSAKGSLVYDGTKTLHIPAHTVKAIDSVGAGDAYAGAFLYGLTHGYAHQEAGALASRAAATVVSQYGPRITKAQAIALKKAVA